MAAQLKLIHAITTTRLLIYVFKADEKPLFKLMPFL